MPSTAHRVIPFIMLLQNSCHEPEEFLRQRFGSCCIHKNVLDLWKLPANFSKMSFEEKRNLLKAGGSQVTQKVDCAKHNRKCSIKPVEFDLSGHCCRDYSPQGNQQGVEGQFSASMVSHFSFLERQKIPIRASENVLSEEGQSATKDSMPGMDTRFVVVACEDAGLGSIRRDRGYLFGLLPPYRWIADPQKLYNQFASELALRQVQQEALWCFDSPEEMQKERQSAATQMRKYTEDGSLPLA